MSLFSFGFVEKVIVVENVMSVTVGKLRVGETGQSHVLLIELQPRDLGSDS